jgi:hypothetical protein
MSVDFFDQKYQIENPRGEAELGIVDSDANTKQPAYIANGIHPKANGFSLTRQQQFKDETNFHLKN